MRPEGLGGRQGRLACGGGVGEPAVGQVDARAQDRQRRLGRDAVQRLGVRSLEGVLRFVKLTEVD